MPQFSGVGGCHKTESKNTEQRSGLHSSAATEIKSENDIRSQLI